MTQEATLPRAEKLTDPPPPVSFFEFWPSWLFYTPIVAHCLLLGIRHAGPTLLTAANPTITAGGLCGETKSSILDQVGPGARHLLARYVAFSVAEPDDVAEAERAMARAGFTYPVVVKPDVGCNGTGVRKIANRAAMTRYLTEFPRGESLLLQEFVPEEGEAGIFYVRHPDQTSGRITSITLKYVPAVVGDGRSSLRQLILADPRAGRIAQLYLPRLADRLHDVPAQGDPVPLVFVGNHCKGSIFYNGTSHVTPELTAAFERIARAIPEFHFGRIDIRFSSLAALGRGEGFRIIEINGSGSEATHIWDPRTRLIDAWRDQFFHYRQAFRIGAANRRRGHRPTRSLELLKLWRNQRRLMASYPLND